MNASSEPDSEKQPVITFRDLYPTLTDQELKEAEKNFRRYVEIALEIHRELSCRAGDSGFDTCPISPTMKERSKFSLKN